MGCSAAWRIPWRCCCHVSSPLHPYPYAPRAPLLLLPNCPRVGHPQPSPPSPPASPLPPSPAQTWRLTGVHLNFVIAACRLPFVEPSTRVNTVSPYGPCRTHGPWPWRHARWRWRWAPPNPPNLCMCHVVGGGHGHGAMHDTRCTMGPPKPPKPDAEQHVRGG